MVMIKMNVQPEKNNISTQYGFILYKAVAKAIGIDMFSKEKLKSVNPEDIIKVQLGSYLHFLLKVVDENEGRKARIKLKEDIVTEEDSLSKALSIDFSEQETETLLKNIKLIYGINAITSTKGNTLYDWDLIIDKRKSKMLGLRLKNNNKELCNLNYPEEIIEMAYNHLNQNDKLLPEYIDEMEQEEKQESSMYDSAAKFLEIYKNNPNYFQECMRRITSVDPQKIVSAIKSNKKYNLPEAYSWWFCTTVNMNKEYIGNRIQKKPYRY